MSGGMHIVDEVGTCLRCGSKVEDRGLFSPSDSGICYGPPLKYCFVVIPRIMELSDEEKQTVVDELAEAKVGEGSMGVYIVPELPQWATDARDSSLAPL